MTLNQEAEKLPEIENCGERHRRAPTTEDVDFSKGALKRKSSSSSFLFEKNRRQRQRLPLLDVKKRLVLNRQNMFFELDPAEKRKGKGCRS